MSQIGATLRKLLSPQRGFDPIAHWDERAAVFREDAARLSRASGEQWLLLGDSLIEQFPAPLLRAVHGACVNRGISSDHLGGSTKSIVSRLDRSLLAPNPTRILLAAGINDLGDAPDDPDLVVRRMLDVIEQLVHRYPGTKLTVQSLLPTRGAHAYLNHGVHAVNRELSNRAASAGVGYLDLNRALSRGGDALHPLFSKDGLHLRMPGYVVWALALHRHWRQR